MTAPSSSAATDALAATLSQALTAGTREAFTALLTDDVRWGGEHGGGDECTTRDQAGDHYASLLAAGVTLRITGLQQSDPAEPGVLTARMQVRSPDPEELPPELAIRLTVRDGLIADIRVLDAPPTIEVLHGTTGAPRDERIIDALIDNPAHDVAIAAIHAGDLPALRQLLGEHSDLASDRLPRHGGRTLLHVATDWPGHYPNVAGTITELVAAGADPNVACLGEHPETPLHWAASSDDVAAIEALLDAGADVNAPGAVIGGGTPIADATAFGQWEAARCLLDHGAATNLFEAAALGLVAQVEQHLATNQPTGEDITSSFWGACHGGHVPTAAVLLDHGADLNWIGYDDLTPLDTARRAGATAVVEWLEQRGALSAAHAT